MGTSIVTYAIVWFVLILYVVNLSITRQKLTQTADALRSQIANQEGLSQATRDDAN